MPFGQRLSGAIRVLPKPTDKDGLGLTTHGSNPLKFRTHHR